jgi:hypothetical protein
LATEQLFHERLHASIICVGSPRLIIVA